MKNGRKIAGLSWEEVVDRAGDQAIVVHFDGIQRRGYWYEDHMMKMFSGCELLQLTASDYQVTKWPERSAT